MIDKKWRFPASVQYSSQLCQTREICFHRIVQICISFIGQIIQYFKELLACVIFYFALSSLTAFLIIAPLIFFKVRLSFTIRLTINILIPSSGISGCNKNTPRLIARSYVASRDTAAVIVSPRTLSGDHLLHRCIYLKLCLCHSLLSPYFLNLVANIHCVPPASFCIKMIVPTCKTCKARNV